MSANLTTAIGIRNTCLLICIQACSGVMKRKRPFKVMLLLPPLLPRLPLPPLLPLLSVGFWWHCVFFSNHHPFNLPFHLECPLSLSFSLSFSFSEIAPTHTQARTHTLTNTHTHSHTLSHTHIHRDIVMCSFQTSSIFSFFFFFTKEGQFYFAFGRKRVFSGLVMFRNLKIVKLILLTLLNKLFSRGQ